jgi:DNA modification methylase
MSLPETIEQDAYREFLISKMARTEESGVEIQDDSINPMLFPFQRDILKWALKNGRSAIFAECGLGKTPVQLEWARHVVEHTGRPVLILAPLAVSQQTKREGEKFGIECSVVRDGDEVVNGINITNYERIEKFDPSVFGGVVLDESSILKSFAGKTKRLLCSSFDQTPFRLCCTATPAPNDHMELGNHSEFLGIMPSSEMLSRWFINDTMNFGTYRLKHHAVKPFWTWVSSWAVCIRKPSDLGYSDDGFILPKLHQHRHVIRADYEALGSEIGEMFYSPTASATSVHKIMRVTAESRAQEVGRIVNESTGPFVVWCHTNYEADALRKAIPEAVEVRGNDKPYIKESKLLGFVAGEFRVLITKPKIAGFGMNWQHCSQAAFVGMSYSYEAFYQAVRRNWRFGQENEVHIHTVMSDAEQQIYDTVMVKAAKHDVMTRNMYENFQFGITGERGLLLDYDRKSETGDGWEMILGDCVKETKTIEDDSVDFSIFSPPFSSLYIYSESARDMGNNEDDEAFFEHFGMLIPELYRVTRPGRLCAVHCKNLVYYKGDRGTAGLRDFRGDIITAFKAHGWDFHSEVTIWKDPVIEMQRTKCHGLLHKQLCKDSTFSRQGLPDYLVIFRKWAKDEDQESEVSPVNGPKNDCRFTEYIGDEPPTKRSQDEPLKHNIGFDTSMVEDADVPRREYDRKGYSIKVWQRYASPVWHDIRQTNVLNCRISKDDHDEKHICPLQLDVIERAVHLWTNPNDLVFSPFAGIGSEGYGALKQGRRFVGVELKDSYFDRACLNLKEACSSGDQLTIFDEVDNG